MKLQSVLIANRGEIASRVIRAARDFGIRAVAVYADSDVERPFVSEADHALPLYGDSPSETYLNITKIISCAQKAKVDAIHPGYGFLSESAEFAAKVIEAGFIWIGPRPETIELLGNKARARRLAQQIGAPLIAGTGEPISGTDEITDFVVTHGYPIVIKAVHGGGGRGLRVVHSEKEIDAAFRSAVSEAEAAFGDGSCLIERFIENPRHIEAQVIADSFGTVAVLGTRDCSLQRRNQKLIEEAPAPGLTDKQQLKITDAATRLCEAVDYVGVGTVEFLLGADGTLSFLEVNTRLQVEHPVTEMTTGIDLVVEQFRIAAGEPVSVPDRVTPFGHAIEFRINAEDSTLGFLPAPGVVTTFTAPSGPGVRIDSGIRRGNSVSGSFDSLLAKLIVWGRDRDEALRRSRRALREFVIHGVSTLLPFHRQMVHSEAFTDEAEFSVHTKWIETQFEPEFATGDANDEAPKQNLLRFSIEVDGELRKVGVLPQVMELLSANGTTTPEVTPEESGSAGDVIAPFNGTFVRWVVDDGTSVESGQYIASIESMKMEVAISAPISGVLHQRTEDGDRVDGDAVLGNIHPE